MTSAALSTSKTKMTRKPFRVPRQKDFLSDDCQRLEVDPTETKALLLMMELLGQDFSYSSIVSDLNEKGFRMRNCELWNRVTLSGWI
jgi:hypothetical protein